MNKICLLLEIALINLVYSTPSAVAQYSKTPKIVCPNINKISNCLCDAYKLICPDYAVSLSIYLDIAEVNIICSDSFVDFPNLHIGDVHTLSVKNCKPTADKSLLETLGHIGVKSIKILKYQNNNTKTPYNPEFLEGLQNLEYLLLDISFEYVDLGGVHNMKLGIFDSLVKLSYLIIRSNKISKLEPGIFRNQRKLEKLDLKHNKLRELNKRTFLGLHCLKHLDLSYNAVDTISEETFSLLPNLTELNLSFNPLSSIRGNLTENRKLKTFSMVSSLVPLTVSSHFLSNVSDLRKVQLRNNSLNELPETLFSGSKTIIELDLSENMLDRLPELLLKDQRNLEYLNLNDNRLTILPEQLFTATQQLHTLLLSNNQLVILTRNIFVNLVKLQELHLENNKLCFIHYNTFHSTKSLKKLYLQNNSLTVLPIRYNEFQRIRDSTDVTTFVQLWKIPLNELDLSYNYIPRLSNSDFNFFSYEVTVDLSHNQISHIGIAKSYQNRSNVKVNLTNNPLNCDCYLLDFVQYVLSENMSYVNFVTDNLHCNKPSELQKIPINRLNTQDLICPLATKNSLRCPRKCDCFIRPTNRTIIVNCTGRALTKIQSLPQPSSINYTFIELHIENNFIKQLPTLSVFNYENIIELYARNNSIKTVSVMNIPTHLRLLDLTHNKLTTINNTVLEKFSNSVYLKSVHLANNNWICDCNTQNLMRFVKKNRLKLSMNNSLIICEDGTTIDSINVDELCDKSTGLLLLMYLASVPFGLLIWLIFALYYYYQMKIKVWLFKHKISHWLETEEELVIVKECDAFISYCHNDAQFIQRILVPRLESEMKFKTYLHERDSLVGEIIPEQIISSIENSRRTIIVLSKHYLESREVWAVHLKYLVEKRVRIIIIIVGEICNVESLGPQLKAYLKMHTCIKYDDPWFWDKLRYAMPHPVTATMLKKHKNILVRKETSV